MQQIYQILITIFFVIMGGVPTLYIFFSIPAIIIWKFYRSVKYNISMMD